MAEVDIDGGTVSIDTTGLSTSSNQTDGSQKSQIVDAGGEVATVTGGKLDVNASIDTTGLATSAKQDTGNTSLTTIANDTTSIDGKITTCNTGAVVISSGSVNATVTATDLDIRDLTSTDVVTITGGAGQTSDVKVTLDSESVTITGTVTANAGTNLNTSALALETGGNLATISGKDFSTSAKQDTGNVSLSTIAGKDFSTETTLALIKAKTDNLDVALSTRTKPADTQTVTGTVTANAGTNLNTSALALEASLQLLLSFNAVNKIMYVDEPDANTTYQGWATANTLTSAASWMIRKIVKSGNVTSILWCDGNQSYDNIWDNRAALSYS